MDKRRDHVPWFELYRSVDLLSFFEKQTKKKLTNISEAIIYKPRVAKSESTIFLKIWFVKGESTLSSFEATRFSMPLMASKNAAAYYKRG